MGSEVQQDHLGNRAEFIVQLLLRSCTSPTRGSAADPWFPGDGHPLCIGLGYSDLRPINQLVSISLFRGCCTLIGQPSLNLGVEAGASWVHEVRAWCSVFPSLTPIALPQAVGAAFPRSLWLHRVGGPLLSKACADPENWGLSGWMCQKPWGPDNPRLRSPVLCGQGAGDFP